MVDIYSNLVNAITFRLKLADVIRIFSKFKLLFGHLLKLIKCYWYFLKPLKYDRHVLKKLQTFAQTRLMSLAAFDLKVRHLLMYFHILFQCKSLKLIENALITLQRRPHCKISLFSKFFAITIFNIFETKLFWYGLKLYCKVGQLQQIIKSSWSKNNYYQLNKLYFKVGHQIRLVCLLIS